jgi:hypothetical protein
VVRSVLYYKLSYSKTTLLKEKLMKKLMLIFLFAVASMNMYAQNVPNDRPLLEKKDVKHIKASLELLLGAGAIVYGLKNLVNACNFPSGVTRDPVNFLVFEYPTWNKCVGVAACTTLTLLCAAVAYGAIKWGLEDLKESERKIY